jgi:fatty acid desaturase
VILALAWLAEGGAGLGAAAQAAGNHLSERLAFGQYAESWHDFYLMTGTAAVTLAGLLFLSLSLHLDQLVEESHAHLLALCRAMLTSFVMVLAASLMMLAPAQTQRVTGFMLVSVGAAGAFVTLKLLGVVQHHEAGGFSKRDMVRRKSMALMGYGLLALSGIGIVLGIQELMNLAIPAFCVLLGNAAGTSFEMLVHVARHKQRTRDAKGA